MAKKAKQRPAHGQPELNSEAASRLLDPFESDYMGVLRSNDPLLLEKGQNLELYRDLKRDGKVFSGLQKRTGALVGRPWAVEPVREENSSDAETLTDILKLFNFDQLCRDLMDAVLMGFSVSEIVWTVRDGYVIPARIPKRRQRRFVYVQSDQDEGPVLRLLTKENMLTGVELPEKKFIVHRVNPEDDNPYGTGLGLQLYWPVFFKRKGIVAWAKLCDRFGSPTPWGKYPRNAGPKEKGTLAEALRAFSNDGYVMTPEGSTIELLESKLGGNITTQEALVNAMNDWIAEVLLGQEPRTTGGGALAAASKERTSVRLDLVQADSDLLSETLNRTLIAWLCEYNGLAPCVVYRQIKEEEDKKAESETDKNVSEMGFELSEEAVRAKYGEGWSKKPPPVSPPDISRTGNPAVSPPGENKPQTPASFAEADLSDPGQQAIDAAISAVPGADLQEAMAGLVEPLLAAIEGADSFEDALAAAQSAFPKMDVAKLQAILARAMFGAETFGRGAE